MRKLIFLLVCIFSLESFAQVKTVKVVLRNDVTIEGEMVEFDPLDHITIMVAGAETKIMMTDVAYIKNKDEEPNVSTDPEVIREKVPVRDDLVNFKGFLMAKGNRVYVYSEDSDYEKAAAAELKKLLEKDGFWTVVDHMQQAHFTISYFVYLTGRDKATISVSSWRTGAAKVLNHTTANEYVKDNIEIVRKLYKNEIIPLQKKIESNKLPKRMIDDFTIK